MKELTRSELQQEKDRLEKMISTCEGMLKGVCVAKQQELERLDKTIASAESILEDLEMRKKKLQTDIQDLTAMGY